MANQNPDSQEVALEIEREVQEISRLIDSRQPEERRELRQIVSSLMDQEVLRKTETIEQAESMGRPMNPLALGLLFLILGGGLFFLLPPVGTIVAIGGILGIVWAAVIGLSGRQQKSRTITPAEDGEQSARP